MNLIIRVIAVWKVKAESANGESNDSHSDDGNDFNNQSNYSFGDENADGVSIVSCSDRERAVDRNEFVKVIERSSFADNNKIPLKFYNFVNGVIVTEEQSAILISTKTSSTKSESKSSFDQEITTIKFNCFAWLLEARDEIACMYSVESDSICHFDIIVRLTEELRIGRENILQIMLENAIICYSSLEKISAFDISFEVLLFLHDLMSKKLDVIFNRFSDC